MSIAGKIIKELLGRPKRLGVEALVLREFPDATIERDGGKRTYRFRDNSTLKASGRGKFFKIIGDPY